MNWERTVYEPEKDHFGTSGYPVFGLPGFRLFRYRKEENFEKALKVLKDAGYRRR